jgi:hypothetical protein
MRLLTRLIVITLLLIPLVALLQTTAFMDGPPDRPTPGPPDRPTPGLPDRPKRSHKEDTHDDNSPLLGAYIELHATPQGENYWAVVQWQDANGSWHDVDGWRSQIDSNPAISWWVGPKDLTTGPFRWVVYLTEDRGKLVWSSQPFYLPKHGETLRIAAAVPIPPTPDSTGFTAMLPEYSPPEILFPIAGGALEASSASVTTALSITATVAGAVAGLLAIRRNRPIR